MNTCSRCNKEIMFVRIRPAGQEERSIPLDPEPVEVTKPGSYIVLNNNIAGFAKLNPGDKGYVSHFATCPFADEYRKKKKKELIKKEKYKPILLQDLAGMMKLIADTKSLIGMKKLWESDEFSAARVKLDDKSRISLIEYKDKLKARFCETQLNAFTNSN